MNATKITLPKALLANLNQAERMLQELIPQVQNAEACGDNCRHHKELMQQLLERIRNYKQYFGK